MPGRLSLLLLLTTLLTIPLRADQSKAAYSKAARFEQTGDYDQAFQFYREAYTLAPRNPKYATAYLRMRFTAATQHIHNGELLRDRGALPEAAAEFRKALAIDNSMAIAQQALRQTTDLLARHQPVVPQPAPSFPEGVGKPVELKPFSNAPITMVLTANADAVYKTLGKIAGFNVIVDPDYKPQKITVDLTNVTLREALEMVRLESKTFWRPVLENAIFVTSDSPAKRKDVEQSVMKTFYLRNIESATELQEAANAIKQMLDLSRIQLVQAQDALILRGTPDQMLLAEKLLSDFDQPKSEVIVDVAVMQVSRDRIRTLGATPPTSVSGALVPTSSSSSGSSASAAGAFTVSALKSLTADNVALSIPGASFSALASDSNTKVLQNPEIRILNNEKATLRIGDRVPIATGSFQPGIVGGGGVSPLISTQFQYLDIGVNIDITPHIHANGEITLKMSLEISSVSGEENIGGITQPIIGQRRIEHEARLTDGEVNLLGGILQDTETQSMSGYPWLSKIPLIRYLFAQDNRERQQNEIVFAITPHIVRSQNVTEENTREIEVGTGNSIELRHQITAPAPQAQSQTPAAAQPSQHNPLPVAPGSKPH